MASLSSSDHLAKTAVKELLDLLKDYGIPQKNRVDAARQVIDLLRNQMSISDANRLYDILRGGR